MLIKKIILLICNFIFLLYADEACGAVVTKTPAYAKSRIADITGSNILFSNSKVNRQNG